MKGVGWLLMLKTFSWEGEGDKGEGGKREWGGC